jgi:hypothetical protein
MKNIKSKPQQIDCVKLKNDIQSKIYKHIKSMNFEEQRIFMQKVISGELKLN